MELAAQVVKGVFVYKFLQKNLLPKKNIFLFFLQKKYALIIKKILPLFLSLCLSNNFFCCKYFCSCGKFSNDFAPLAKVGCESDSECPSQLACINAQCKNPCEEGRPCGINAECRVLDTLPVRTMLCECLPGYRGNAAVQCDLRKKPKKNLLFFFKKINLSKKTLNQS